MKHLDREEKTKFPSTLVVDVDLLSLSRKSISVKTSNDNRSTLWCQFRFVCFDNRWKFHFIFPLSGTILVTLRKVRLRHSETTPRNGDEAKSENEIELNAKEEGLVESLPTPVSSDSLRHLAQAILQIFCQFASLATRSLLIR